MVDQKEKTRKLTAKQAAFVQEYLIDLNATRAAKDAGYSQRRAMEIGYQLLHHTTVAEAIQKAKKARENRTEITQDRVLQELAKIGFADIKDFLVFRTAKTIIDINRDGECVYDYAHVVELKDSEEVDGALISEVQLKDGTLKFKLYDKEKALEMVAKHLGMFKPESPPPPPVNIQNNITIVDELTAEERRKLILNASKRLQQDQAGAGQEAGVFSVGSSD